MKKLRPHILPIISLGLLALGIAYHAWQSYVPPNTVVLRDTGFYPESLAVEVGTTVTFVNRSRVPFWPASDSHPQHNVYAAFDAGHPIAPGASWSFTFDRPGAWGFHDHLHSYFIGEVLVGAEAVSYDCVANLSGLDVGAKRECWNDTLAKTFRKEGAAAAFRQFASFYSSDPDFTKVGCHIIAHQLGDVAYGEYVRHGNDLSKLDFPPESVYCGYGYYHGILEHKIRDHPDFAKADGFCKELVREYESTVPRIQENCYHAIGHGFIPEPTDVEAWGDPARLATPAIAACRNLTNETLRSECMQGAFNVIADWLQNSQFGMKMPEEDSLALCRSFDDLEVSRACYYELSMKVLPFAGSDIRTVYQKYAASIEDDALAAMVMHSATAGILGNRITEDNFIPLLMDCRSLPERVREDCLKGITGGFVAHGEPEREYVKALDFCGDEALTGAEKEICYQNVFRTFRSVYTPEKIEELCSLIDPEYQRLCYAPA